MAKCLLSAYPPHLSHREVDKSAWELSPSFFIQSSARAECLRIGGEETTYFSLGVLSWPFVVWTSPKRILNSSWKQRSWWWYLMTRLAAQTKQAWVSANQKGHGLSVSPAPKLVLWCSEGTPSLCWHTLGGPHTSSLSLHVRHRFRSGRIGFLWNSVAFQTLLTYLT